MQNLENTCGEEKNWWQRNRKRILIAGGIVVVIVGGGLLFKNRDNLTELAAKILGKGQKPIQQPVEVFDIISYPDIVPDSSKPIFEMINGGEAFPVKGHLRNLSGTRNSSPKQRAFAEARGITLGDHQTYVRDYMKNCA